jgi:hypothetical protein
MDLTDKTIEITQLSTSAVEQRSSATVELLSPVGDTGVLQSVGTYRLTFAQSFQSIDDPNLYAAAIAVLEGLP